jgi:hypothetical protein
MMLYEKNGQETFLENLSPAHQLYPRCNDMVFVAAAKSTFSSLEINIHCNFSMLQIIKPMQFDRLRLRLI